MIATISVAKAINKDNFLYRVMLSPPLREERPNTPAVSGKSFCHANSIRNFITKFKHFFLFLFLKEYAMLEILVLCSFAVLIIVCLSLHVPLFLALGFVLVHRPFVELYSFITS